MELSALTAFMLAQRIRRCRLADGTEVELHESAFASHDTIPEEEQTRVPRTGIEWLELGIEPELLDKPQ